MLHQLKVIETAQNEVPSRVPELISIHQLSERWQISAKRLRRACGARHDDPLPCIRIGHTIRFNLNDERLAEWLERRTAGGTK